MKRTTAISAWVVFGMCCLPGGVALASLHLFMVNIEFMLDQETDKLTATVSDDIELIFTADVTADFVLVLQSAFSATPSGGYGGESDPFDFERNGQEVLPSASQVEMGYLAAPLEAIAPGDFFFEIGEVSFAEGDTFTISGGMTSIGAWSGAVPDAGPSFQAFLATSNGAPIENVELIPEPRATAVLAGVFAVIAVGLRLRRRSPAHCP